MIRVQYCYSSIGALKSDSDSSGTVADSSSIIGELGGQSVPRQSGVKSVHYQVRIFQTENPRQLFRIQ